MWVSQFQILVISFICFLVSIVAYISFPIKTRGCSGQTDTKILMEMEKKLIFEQS